MTDESREESFGNYWVTKRAVAAYGLSEDFDEDLGFDPATSPSWTENLLAQHTRGIPAELRSQSFPRFVRVIATAGKTHILDTYSISLATPVVILPSLLVTSEAGRPPVASGPSDSMATQQPTNAEENRVEQLIWSIGTTSSIRHRARVAARITELQQALQEEETDGRGITVRSLQYFFDFLKAHPNLRCPTISATPERNIYASWKEGSNRVFSVHFLPDSNVRFVIFCPNEKHATETIRLSGTATVDVIIEIARPHGVLNWSEE